MSFRARWTVALAVVAAAAGCSRGPEPEGGRAPGPVPVVVATAVQKAVPVQVRAIATVQPSNTVTVRSRIGGVLARVHFKEGQDVRDGDLLFTIDRRPLEAELRQAEANLARSRAQLENARKDAARYAELARQGFVAQQQYDQMRTNAAALEATARADRAAVENARIQLGYATIRAPMAGRTGTLLVHQGDMVRVNETALVVVNRLAPIDVAFALPEAVLPEVQRFRAQGPVLVEAVSPAAGAAAGEVLGRGELTFVDNRVDPATGTIQLKASFPNAEGRLWPGQFVNVVVTLTTEPAATVVPTQAVQLGQQGRYVFVVKPDRTVEPRPVAVARELGPEAVIAQGVAPGETVVTEGQLRLFPGAKVEPRAATAAGPAEGAASPPSSPGLAPPAAPAVRP